MKFKPKSDEELNAFDLFPAGEYDFEVIKALDEVSKKGNEMIKLELDIYSANGGKTRVFDYLLESVAYKIKHFCKETGLMNLYEQGSLSADICKNKSGRCTIGIQKDKTGEYPDKNVVKDYGKKGSKINHSLNMQDDISDSEIPF